MKETFFLMCVLHLTTGHLGVVVTRDIHDHKTGKDWVIMEGVAGEESAGIDELKSMPCSKVPLNKLKNKDYVMSLLNR